MAWTEARLDTVLVPAGVLVLVLYHVLFAYRILKHPTSTVIGVNDLNRQVWVRTMMKDSVKNGTLSVQTLRNNIMASTLLATATITLSSIIVVLAAGSAKKTIEGGSLVLGDKSQNVSSVKLLCVLICFLVSFLCNIQSVRYYCHVSFLISIPVGDAAPGLTPEYVNRAITRGYHFWSIGLRALYFSFPFFLWLFGPIPMFVCSLIMANLLYFLDTAKSFKQTLEISEKVSL